MAFSYTITGTRDLQGAKLVHGTWDATGVTSGTITFGGTRGGNQGTPWTLVDATVISSTSSTTMTAAKMTATGTLALTCVSGDAGYWSVTVL